MNLKTNKEWLSTIDTIRTEYRKELLMGFELIPEELLQELQKTRDTDISTKTQDSNPQCDCGGRSH